jgi:hypothetical protein
MALNKNLIEAHKETKKNPRNFYVSFWVVNCQSGEAFFQGGGNYQKGEIFLINQRGNISIKINQIRKSY